jgi:hypothetical protein
MSRKSKLDEALDKALAGIGPVALMVAGRRLRLSVLNDAEAALEDALRLIREFRRELNVD